MEEIRFDDIEGLRKKIQDGFGPWSQPIEVTQEMINRFADVTGDHQWIHIDVERAKRESPFGTTVAHGFLTLSLIPKLSAGGAWRVTGFGNATNYGAEKLRFVSPVPAGSWSTRAPGSSPPRRSRRARSSRRRSTSTSWATSAPRSPTRASRSSTPS
jgi:hypothetical protein